MGLTHWGGIGGLRDHAPTLAEITQLLDVVDWDLADAAVTHVNADNRFVHAKNAGLQLCVLAIHASGVRIRRPRGSPPRPGRNPRRLAQRRRSSR